MIFDLLEFNRRKTHSNQITEFSLDVDQGALND